MSSDQFLNWSMYFQRKAQQNELAHLRAQSRSR